MIVEYRRSSIDAARAKIDRRKASHIDHQDLAIPDANLYRAMFVDVCRRNPPVGLCQNCVTYPRNPRSTP